MVIILKKSHETKRYVVYSDSGVPNPHVIYLLKEEATSIAKGKGYPDKIEITVEAKLG